MPLTGYEEVRVYKIFSNAYLLSKICKHPNINYIRRKEDNDRYIF